MLVAEDQHGQALMIGVERLDRHLARTRKRQTLDIEAGGLRGGAGEQPFYRRACGSRHVKRRAPCLRTGP